MAYKNFPSQLHLLLQTLDANGMSHIASFQPHGRAFLVHERDQFVNNVMPRWFRQTKYASFQRQLNIYGFQRITIGPDQDAYYHADFLRGDYARSLTIRRIVFKGTNVRRPAIRENEPNFYAIPYEPYEVVGFNPAEKTKSHFRDNARDRTTFARGMDFDQDETTLTYSGMFNDIASFSALGRTIPSRTMANSTAEKAFLHGSLNFLPLLNTAAFGNTITTGQNRTTTDDAFQLLIGTHFRPLDMEPAGYTNASIARSILQEQAKIDVIKAALHIKH